MALKFYYTSPFTTGTAILPPDFFVGDNVTDTFSVVNKSIYDVASTIQFSTTQLYQYAGGFTKDVNTSEVTLAEIPPQNTQGIIPGDIALVFSSYDQANVTGVNSSTANVDEQYFYLADVDEINLYGYVPRSGSGIGISFVDAITSAGASLSWVQLACCDSSGNALTYSATGVTLYTPPLDQFGLVSASANSATLTLGCVAASTFIPGDYIFINFGNATQEIVRFVSSTGNTMTFSTSFNYPHYVDETLFACARQFKAKQTTPINATGGVAANYIDLYLSAIASQYRRF